jgi:hypothetical protein
MARHDLLVLHTMVGSLWGTDGYFRRDGYGGAESHFGVGHDGECLQWQDTAHKAEANGNGNHRIISVETADLGTGFAAWNTNDGNAVPAWTPQQLARLVDLTVWACRTHDIPCVLVPDSKPERRGIGYHRLGVPGYAVAGGELWSSARGKVCPGNRRIAQIPGIVMRAAQILSAAAAPAPTPTRKREVMLQNHRVAPGSGAMRLNCPTGDKASALVKRAWISATVDGPNAGWMHVFFQSDSGGIADARLPIRFADGRSERVWRELPNGTTTMNILYNFPNGGCITLEAEPM